MTPSTKALTKATLLALSTALLFSATLPARADITWEDANRFVKNFDINRDGMLSKQELMDRMNKMMKDMKSDKAGMVDEKKAMAFLLELQRGDGNPTPQMISKEVLMKKVLTAFERLDAEKKGMLDAKRTMQLIDELARSGG